MSEQQEVPSQIGKMLGHLVEYQRHFGGMSVQDREWVIRNTPEAILLIVNAVENREVEKSLAPLFSVIATTSLDSVFAKPTELCFVGSQYSTRDKNFDNWLPAKQRKADACIITTLYLRRSWTLAEVTAKVLGITNASLSAAILGKLLIKNGYTMTPAQVEEMINRTECRKYTGMKTKDHGTFFFVETRDPRNPVSVGRVFSANALWYTYISRIYLERAWEAGSCLLVPNLDYCAVVL